MSDLDPAFLAAIQPIVLVGGKSRRFGRDKLREPLNSASEFLVDRPIATLRAVFGARVALVGACDPTISRRGDSTIADRWPDAGPAGGIASALEIADAVFVLAGDLPAIDVATVHTILGEADAQPGALAVLARATHPEPCVGLYRANAHNHLERAARDGSPLWRAIPDESVRWVPVDPRSVRGANTPDELRDARRSPD